MAAQKAQSSGNAAARPNRLFLCKWPAPGHQTSLVAAENEDVAAKLLTEQLQARRLQVGRLASTVQIKEFNESFVLEFVPQVPEPGIPVPRGEKAIECLRNCELLQADTENDEVVAAEAMGLTLQSSSQHARYGDDGLNVQRAATRAFDGDGPYNVDSQYNIAAALRGISGAADCDGQGTPGNRPKAMLKAVQDLYDAATQLVSQEPGFQPPPIEGGDEHVPNHHKSDAKGPASSAGATTASPGPSKKQTQPPIAAPQGGASSSQATPDTDSTSKLPASGSKATPPGGRRGMLASGGSPKLKPEAPTDGVAANRASSPAALPKGPTVEAAAAADTNPRASRQTRKNVTAGRAASADLVAGAALIATSDSDEEPTITSRAKSESRK